MHYFVTGATGFIGRFLVPLLLARGATVYVLVRASSCHKVAQLRQTCDVNERRLRAVSGDLTEPCLGVTPSTARQLCGHIDHFFHLAAIYDLEADLDAQVHANVQGTRNALALAHTLRVGCFHYVSSIAVAGLYAGTFTEDMLEQATGLTNPYLRTKHDAEVLVRRERNIPWRIYRPGIVVGHSLTGQIDKVDGPYYFFDLVRRYSGYLPGWLPLPLFAAARINIVPVDFVVKAMDYLAHLADHDGECFLLTHPSGIATGELLRELSAQANGPTLHVMGRQLAEQLPWAVLNTTLARVLEQPLSERVLARLGVPAAALEFIAYPTRFDASKTHRLLKRGHIHCPDFADYAEVIWRYWEQNLVAAPMQSRPVQHLTGSLHLRTVADAARGKVVVVTGATSGIGHEVALKLAAAGAIVILAARTPEKLQLTLNEIADLGGTGYAYACDIADMSACDRFVDEVLADHGHVDILVNNAGRSIRRSVQYSFDRFHDFERTMQLNYFGALRLIMGFAPVMLERQSGHIINISSIGVLTSPPRFSAYVASKAALDAFSWCVAAEFADRNVRFTTINMPLVKTPMIAPTKLYEAFPTLSADQAAERVMKAITEQPKRVASALGIAGAVAQAVAPNTSEFWLNQAYKLFPDSASARGLSAAEAAAEAQQVPTRPLEIARRLFAQVLRGVHW